MIRLKRIFITLSNIYDEAFLGKLLEKRFVIEIRHGPKDASDTKMVH